MLLLSLCYQPTDNTITITIIKARNLKAKDINGLSGEQRGIKSCIGYAGVAPPGDYTIPFMLRRRPIYRHTGGHCMLRRMAENTVCIFRLNEKYDSGFLYT